MSSQPIHFDNTFVNLPEAFFRRVNPAQVSHAHAICTNTALAAQLGIDTQWLQTDAATQVFAGQRLLEGADPIATVYAGHQFGGWNPQLGDGRALLLGEVMAPNGQRYDIQLKGSGRTPFSRMGDGLSPLGPVLREYIVSEAMAALGIPTTRSLAAVTTGDQVVRDQIYPGAILTRVARSHIRVGHFQYFYARNDLNAVRQLADHVIARDFPEAQNAPNPYVALLTHAIERQADLIAQWQLVGFVHGVMNTDNMLVGGETIDYGPCAFMDEYDPELCLSSIDQQGRYAYKNQPAIAQWNLSWLAQALLPLLNDDEAAGVEQANQLLGMFASRYEQAYAKGMARKFGFEDLSEKHADFVQAFLPRLAESRLDFTLVFRHLADTVDPNSTLSPVDFMLPESFTDLLQVWQAFIDQQADTRADIQARMYQVNPAVIPRNHLVEAAINAAQRDNDFAPFHQLVDVLAAPYDYTPDNHHYTQPPAPQERVLQTFCGT